MHPAGGAGVTASKSERLVNLTILLLVANRPLTKERIRAVTEPYRTTSAAAFEKMFERDKEDLRALGIPIELVPVDAYFDDEHGYTITRDAFELPEVDFTPEEAAVLGLAARVWQHAGLAAATSEALLKLKAGGVDFDRAQLESVQPSLVAEEPSFEAMWRAATSRAPVSFDYRRPGQSEWQRRHLEPWGVVTADARWYVVGHDRDRGETRMFRLSRVGSDVQVGEPGSFRVPDGTDLRAVSASLAPPADEHRAVVLARTGAALGLRRRAEPAPAETGGVITGWDRLVVRYGSTDRMVTELLGYADAVRVQEPEELRAELLSRLRRLARSGEAS